MKTVREIADEIVAREGGFVNDPDDPGGATNFGITIHTMRRLGIELTGDGAITVADVRKLTRSQAVEIMIEYYFVRPRVAELPAVLRASVFDMYVNAGGNAVRILQSLLQQMGQRISVDGLIGPQTIRAADAAYEIAPDHLSDCYGVARRNYYFRLADNRRSLRKFARTRAGGKGGWIRRAEAFLNPRFHMTDREFAERTKSWD